MGERRTDQASARNALLARVREGGIGGDAGALAAFLRVLERHHSARFSLNEGGAANGQTLLSLRLGLASLECDHLHRGCPGLLPQIALLGPTQAGKSSLANALLGRELAEVSPLAGFTTQPHGFCCGPDAEATIGALGAFFSPLRRVDRDQASRDRFDCYTLTDITEAGNVGTVTAACFWDTPDFDSVDSGTYRGQVLRVAALADLVILVLSKDKYSDQSVWDMVSLLQPLGHPRAIVLNKIDDRARSALLESLEEKWRSARVDPLPFVVTLPFLDVEEAVFPVSSIEGLGGWIERELAEPGRRNRRQRTRALLGRHWAAWLTPVRAELEADAEWRAAIDRGIEEVLACYRRDYLDHPQHYETFQRALARLLTLLEIPGVAGLVASARRMLTWPLRQVTTIGHRLIRGTAEADPTSGDQAILEQLTEHLLLQLQQTLWAKREQDSPSQLWWRDFAQILRDAHGELKAQLQLGIADYARAFQTEIDRTARSLYQRLETRPVILNSLRATRITTDAAALAFALHSGGIGIQDFVIAPATLSLTSMLTESALGRYVNRAADDLRARQFAAVSALLQATLGESLARLPDRLDDTRHFKLSTARVEHAEQLLAAYE